MCRCIKISVEFRVTGVASRKREKKKEEEREILAIPGFFADYYVRNARALETRDNRRRSGN